MSAKTKSFSILIAILIVLVALFFIWKPPLEKQNNDVAESITIDNIDEVRKIEIIHGEETTFLSKDNDIWLISSQENIPANPVLIESLLANLKEITTGQIISSNTDKFTNFELSEDKASQLKLYDQLNNLLFQLYIGKIGGPSYNQTYVRLPNSDNTLLVEVNLISLINPADWKIPEPAPEADTVEIAPEE